MTSTEAAEKINTGEGPAKRFHNPPACGRPLDCRIICLGGSSDMANYLETFDREGIRLPMKKAAFNVCWKCVTCGTAWKEPK